MPIPESNRSVVTAAIKLHLLGTFKLIVNDQPLPFYSDRVRALLAYLILEANHPHARDELVALLWPESANRSHLRDALYRLRKDLERADSNLPDALLESTRDTLRARLDVAHATPLWCDVTVFQRLLAASQSHSHADWRACDVCLDTLIQATALYQEGLLHSFILPQAFEFEEWLTIKREGARRQMEKALETVQEMVLFRRDYAGLEKYARRLLTISPWHATGQAHLMRALALQGRRDAALEQYTLYAQTLQREFGHPPSADVSALYQQIHSYALGWEGLSGEPENPYKGLQAFEEEDSANFFGREVLIAYLLQQLSNSTSPESQEVGDNFLALIGPSGCGKSSLVYGGLLPALRRGDVSGAENWRILTLRPGAHPLETWCSALQDLAPTSWERPAHDDPHALSTAITQVLALLDSPRLLVVIDQFEETFTLIPQEAQRADFIQALLQALRDHPQDLSVLITLRADFYDQPLHYPELGQLVSERSIDVYPLTPQQLEQAIVKPAQRVSVGVEEGLVATIITDTGRRPGALPLLQYVLTVMFAHHRQGRVLTQAAYHAVGGISGALARHAEEVYATLTAEEQALAQQLFLRMVNVDARHQKRHGIPDTRRRVVQATLQALTDRIRVDAVLKAFSDHRLLTFDRDLLSGEPMVEIAHEALLEAWPRLAGWLSSNRQDIYLHRQLANAADEWHAQQRSSHYLATGGRLERYAVLTKAGTVTLTPLEDAFVQASLAERANRRGVEREQQAREAQLEQRNRARLSWFVAWLTVAFVITLLLAGVSFHQQHRARRESAIAHSLNLATGAQLALNEGQTGLALALAIQANQIEDPPPQAQLILSEAAYAPSARYVLEGHTAAVESVAFSPNCGTVSDAGCWALSASADHTLILWDIASAPRLTRHLEGHSGSVHSVAFLPDGQRALSASADGTLILWNLEHDEILRRFTGHTDSVWDVAILPDCGDPATPTCSALSASADGTLRLWDIATGQTRQVFTGHTAAVYCVAITPDGQLAISGSDDRGLIVWDLEAGDIVHQMPGHDTTYIHNDPLQYTPQLTGHQGAVRGVAIAPNGRMALSVSEDNFSILWDLETGVLIREFQAPRTDLYSVAFIPNGRLAVLGTLDGRVSLLNAYYGETMLEFLGHQGRVMALDVSAKGDLILSGSADGTVRLWDLSNSAEIRQLHFIAAGTDLAISPDGSLGLEAHWSGELSLWDIQSGEIIRKMVGHTEMPFAGVAFSPDGQLAFSGSGDIFGEAQDNTLRVWDVATGAERLRFEGHTDKLWDIDISHDGRWAVSGSHDGTARLWDITTSLASGQPQGQVLVDVAPQAVRSVAFSPDDHTLLLGLAKGSSATLTYDLRLVDRTTGATLSTPGTFAGHTEAVQDIAWSPDGRQALSAGLDKVIILWDVASGREIQHFVGHRATVNKVLFSPGCDPAADNSRECWVLSAGADNTIILWDIASGQILRRYRGHQGGVLGLVFTPGGHTILSTAVDDTVREWRVDLNYDTLMDWIAANRYVPELTCQQRIQYHVEPLCTP